LNVYADSSFLVPLYLAEVHSPEATLRMRLKPEVSLTPFNRIEVAHSLYQQAFRKHISVIAAKQAWNHFEQDCANDIWTLVELPAGIWETSILLAEKHGPTLGVRTLDSLHVACALELKAERFWTFDERQARLAEAVGLDTSA
jgi:predicted nucleic acid-binding protein